MINNSIIFQYQFFNISLSLCNYLNFSLVMQLYFFTFLFSLNKSIPNYITSRTCYEPALLTQPLNPHIQTVLISTHVKEK